MSELVYVRKTCRLCNSPDIVRSVPLASVPIVSPNVGTEDGVKGERLTRIVAPLDNYLCQACGLNQLVHVVDPSLIYRGYLYRTAVSLGLAEHFRGLADAVVMRLGLQAGDLVAEFGSNDGTLLSFFKQAGMRVQGIDPARQIAAEATAKGVPTMPEFFNPEIATRIVKESGTARAIVANNAMANIDGLDEILAGVRGLLAPDGAFVFETQYALDVFEKTLLDVIYHEHISTFSVRPVVRAFARHGLAVFDAERIATKGGSIRFWVQLAGGPRAVAPRVAELMTLEETTGLYDLAYHERFAAKIADIKIGLHRLIDVAKTQGGTIAGFGTSVGCAALIHQFELEDRLDVLLDDTPFKPRLEGPGYDLPVLKGVQLAETAPALVIVLAWRYAEPIIAKQEAYISGGGRFVVPLPDLTVKP